jgi:hypothetical protein
VKLRKREKRKIGELLWAGMQPVQVIKRAQSLRLLEGGQSAPQVARNLDLSVKPVWPIGSQVPPTPKSVWQPSRESTDL